MPCSRLNWPYGQLLSARKYIIIVSYRRPIWVSVAMHGYRALHRVDSYMRVRRRGPDECEPFLARASLIQTVSWSYTDSLMSGSRFYVYQWMQGGAKLGKSLIETCKTGQRTDNAQRRLVNKVETVLDNIDDFSFAFHVTVSRLTNNFT